MQVQHSRIRYSPFMKTKQLLQKKLVYKKSWHTYTYALFLLCTFLRLVEDKLRTFNTIYKHLVYHYL